jgi:flagellar hook assembly protein FlgD
MSRFEGKTAAAETPPIAAPDNHAARKPTHSFDKVFTMSRLPGVSDVPTTTAKPFGDATALNELKIDDFLDLMIAELQNQDPLNPLENDELLAQISQIREVGATDKLTETLDAVLLGQNVASATSLLGQEVTALTADGRTVTGTVDRVTIRDGQPELHIDAASRAAASDVDGQIEAGTYRYKVVYERPDGQLAGIELGPLTTTGTTGLYASIALTNLPPTPGMKSVYRTDASGEGDFYLLNNVADGSITSYVDGLSNEHLSSATLRLPTVPSHGGQHFVATLANVSEVRSD